jgi:hypothetical protein
MRNLTSFSVGLQLYLDGGRYKGMREEWRHNENCKELRSKSKCGHLWETFDGE